MRQKLLAAIVGSTLLMGAGWAYGQTRSAAPPPDVKYKQKTVYDFEDDVVEGDLVRPDGTYVDTRRKAKTSSLIKIREHFIPEMIKSVEISREPRLDGEPELIDICLPLRPA